MPPKGYSVEGHAIICDNNCIADANGMMPDSLKNPVDWAYFQAHLDQSAIVITGRLGHEMHPNRPGRQRLVFTTNAGDGAFSRQGDVAFVDPERFSLAEAFYILAPKGGMVAVTGGTQVFDWFARSRWYSAFHLVRAHGVKIKGGRPLFTSEFMTTAQGPEVFMEKWECIMPLDKYWMLRKTLC
jgi:dihydrofolate reductase